MTLINDFEAYILPRMPNSNTAKNYISQINKFLKDHPDADRIIRDDDVLLDTMTLYLSKKEKARCYDLKFAFKKFLEFLNKPQLYGLLPRAQLLVRKEKVKSVKFSDVKRLVESSSDERIKLIIMLQYDTAARIAAVLKINVSDISEDAEKQLRISMQEKNQRLRTVYLSPSTINYLTSYIEKNKIKNDLFKDLDYKSVWNHISDLSEKILDKHISTHWFRHSRIMYLVEKGYRLETIQNVTGHKSLDSLRRYAEEAGIKTKLLSTREQVKW